VNELGWRAGGYLWDLLRAPLLPATEFYWPHLLGALVIAVLAYAWAGGRSPREFLRETFAGRVWWHRSARVDYVFYLVNGVLYLMLVGPWLLTLAGIALPVRSALTAMFGRGPVFFDITWWAVALFTLAYFIAKDFGRWLGHWLQHRIPLLWEFHKVHHSAEVLVPLTNARAHPLDLIIMAVVSNIFVGVVVGVAIYLYPGRFNIWHVAQINIVIFAFDVLGSNLRHAPVWLSYGPRLERWLISPAQHQLHHSTDPKHWHKNMGFVLAVWDRLFGTLYVPKGREQVTYGLGDGSEAEYQSVWRLYWLPVKRAWARLVGPLIKRRVDA
jgi:sterol desaturase/sphingolipid hydroxylase (fatty acid hydroxylase superfamily)